jgi:GNAT superfamily N-acetyltransferase
VAGLTVRPAGVDDAEGFVRAYERSWDAALSDLAGRRLEELSPYEERLKAFRRTFGAELPEGAGAWVVEAGGEIVGVATRNGPEVRALYVVPEAWGTGGGRALLDEVLAEIRAGGAMEATLWVVEGNVRARRFYEREGWEPTGETRETPLGPVELQYALQLRA